MLDQKTSTVKDLLNLIHEMLNDQLLDLDDPIAYIKDGGIAASVPTDMLITRITEENSQDAVEAPFIILGAIYPRE